MTFRVQNVNSLAHLSWRGRELESQNWCVLQAKAYEALPSKDSASSRTRIERALQELWIYMERTFSIFDYKDARYRHPIIFSANSASSRDTMHVNTYSLSYRCVVLIPLMGHSSPFGESLGSQASLKVASQEICAQLGVCFKIRSTKDVVQPSDRIIRALTTIGFTEAGPLESLVLPRFLRQEALYTDRSPVLNSFDRWLRWLLNQEDKNGIFVTFMFNHLSSNQNRSKQLMASEIEGFYRSILTRIIRRPLSKAAERYLPLLVAAPDYPRVNQRRKIAVEDVTVNGGVHYHGIFVAPSRSRLTHSVVQEILDNQTAYCGGHGIIRRIHADEIKYPGSDFVGYALKSISDSNFDFQDLIVLPRSRIELS